MRSINIQLSQRSAPQLGTPRNQSPAASGRATSANRRSPSPNRTLIPTSDLIQSVTTEPGFSKTEKNKALDLINPPGSCDMVNEATIAALTGVLKRGIPSDKKVAVHILLKLLYLSKEKNDESLLWYKSNILTDANTHLIPLLNNSDPDLLADITRLMMTLMTKNPSSHEKLLSNGLTDALNTMFEDEQRISSAIKIAVFTSRLNAANTILKKDDTILKIFYHAIPPATVSCDADTLSIASIVILGNLCMHPDVAKKICSLGGIELLTCLINNQQNAYAQFNALIALNCIIVSGSPDHAIVIQKAIDWNAIPRLFSNLNQHVLESPMKHEKSPAHLMQHALHALNTIVRNASADITSSITAITPLRDRLIQYSTDESAIYCGAAKDLLISLKLLPSHVSSQQS
jgi:hypothetical protein